MSGLFENSTVSRVQQANDIVDIIGEHVSLAKKGREMVGLCPFHDDHRPSMYVNPAKQIYKCFACGAGGDVFKFLQLRENLTFPQAIERLAERAGIKIKPLTQARARQKRDFEKVDPNRLAKANAWAAKYFQQNLSDKQKGESARDYVDERKISPESVKKWQIGLAVSNDDLVKTANTRKASIDMLIKAGLVTAQNHDKFTNRLMFPITDVTGRTIGLGGRTLDGADAKYINSPTTVLFDKSNCLYGLEQARHQIVSTGQGVVVEGYTDCIMAHQFGCTNVVATLGTSFTSGHARLLKRYAKKIVLVFDSDTAGIEAANRALEICLAQRIDIKVACVPEGKDPCDFILAAGKEKFEQMVESATDVFQFKWNRLNESFNSDDTLTGKKRAIEEFLQTVATAVSAGNLAAIDRGLIVNRLSKIIALDSKQINAELARRITGAQRTLAYNLQNQKVTNLELPQGYIAAAQKEILEVLLNEPDLYETSKQKITTDLFDIPILIQIAVILLEMLNEKPSVSLAEILARVESVEAGNLIVQLAESGEKKGNFQTRLNGALEAIQQYRQHKKKNDIKSIKDENKFLERFIENAGRRNPRNMGMT
jgi:DNA primase